ncbi:hypothetical protein EVAR_87471_1 [Eumeta japonica]|uniref:Uncharacterized protein n=1 Tax=Eumeta variegata TaxID=151549 RepID=A0A4C1W067_EUMVA|nr:hypothetical protein EVAR_87471_1 [Eumeta japonica]
MPDTADGGVGRENRNPCHVYNVRTVLLSSTEHSERILRAPTERQHFAASVTKLTHNRRCTIEQVVSRPMSLSKPERLTAELGWSRNRFPRHRPHSLTHWSVLIVDRKKPMLYHNKLHLGRGVASAKYRNGVNTNKYLEFTKAPNSVDR